MFSWGNKVPLAETLGLNTLKYRETRDNFVKEASDNFHKRAICGLISESKKSTVPEAKFDFTNVAFCGQMANVAMTDNERERVIAYVSDKLKEDKLEVSVEGVVLTVKWSVPVQSPAVPEKAPEASPEPTTTPVVDVATNDK